MASTKVQRIMTQPINLIFRFLQSKARIQIWLFEQKDLRIEGRIIVLQALTSPLKVIITHPIPHVRCLLDFLLNNRRWKMPTF
ncbi:PREDICTED: uncharacterized protein LOC105121272 isoform X2 [Populus euphratica]|uniref:Uncharacterized protein LOC105121272 isoform X2 n=1 Tax=Populus euphratica TaxID=75702 RepID=A0AAJ6TW08_POPEU|nr:PREDICTED: uncharacterized protein LOC105121272 isoform X2 [Populus euphratica]